jgi:uncharacterized damage-inducible protein DinB
MTDILSSIESEFRRYKRLAEGAIAQLDEAEFSKPAGAGNSIAILVWHISGNLKSRFTDFLTSDGEKPWRARDEEFVSRSVDRAQLIEKWEEGWTVLFAALGTLNAEDLARTVTIRNQPMAVHEALERSLSHVSYHVGQIVYIAKSLCGDRWKYMSIPPGKSEEVNKRLRSG